MVQWLGPRVSTVGGMCLIPGQGTKTPQASKTGKFFFKIINKSQDSCFKKSRATVSDTN